MKIERTKNTIRNTKWGLLQKFVNIFFPFVVRTVLIHTLSAEHAGLSSLFTSILHILSLTELGFSNAIVFSMYKPIAEDNKEKICALLNLYKKAYRIVGIAILVLGVMLIPFLPHLISGSIPPDVNLYVLYCVYLVNTVISYFLFAYKTSLLSAHQREDVVSKNTLIYNIGLYAFQCIVLILFRNYYLYSLLIPVATVCLNLLNNREVNKLFPEYVAKGSITTAEKTEIKKNLIGLMMSRVAQATRNTLDSIVISAYIGLVSVAMYNNYFYVINGVIAFLGVVLTSMVAGIGNKIAMDTPENNYKDFCRFHFYYMWIAGWCTVSLMCLYQPFMKLWMGEELMFSNGIMFLFCLYFFMLKMGDVNSMYYQAAGLWWYGKYKAVVEAVMNLTLNIILGKYFGVLGILLATLIAFVPSYLYGSTFIFSMYFKNGKLYVYHLTNLIFMGISAVVGFSTFSLMQAITARVNNTIIVLAIGGVLCLVIPNILFAAVSAINEQYRGYMLTVYRRLRKKIGKA